MQQNTTNFQFMQPVILGSGMSGQAIIKSLELISSHIKPIQLLPIITAERGTSLSNYISSNAINITFIGTPSGLHAAAIIESERAGYNAVICDKPVCVNKAELEQLKNVLIPVNVLHGYRVMWGPIFYII